MATFNPQQDTVQPQNYAYHSRGIDASPNTGLGNLFKGLADTLNTGVQAADQQERKNILDDIQNQASGIQDEFGVGAATDLQADAGTGNTGKGELTPVGLQQAGQQLDSLQNAYEKGTLKESYYWARLNVMTRQLRAKYPGYSDQIDSMVASVVGARPANALQSQLFNEWQEAQTAAQNSPLSKLEDYAVKNGTLPPDYFQRQQNNDPYSFPELQSYVAKKTADKFNTEAAHAQLSLAMDQNRLDQNDIENQYRVDATQFVNSTLADQTKGLGKNYAQVKSLLDQTEQNIQNGHQPDADALNSLTAQMNQLRQDMALQLHQQFLQSWDGDPNHSYVAKIDGKTESDIQAQALQPIDLMIKALNDKDFGVLGSMAAYLSNQQNDATKKLLDNVPLISTLAAVNQKAGASVAGLVLSTNPNIQNALTKSMVDYAALQAQNDPNFHVTDAVKSGESANQKADYYQALVTSWQNLSRKIGDPKTPLPVIKNAVNYMFGEDSGKIMAELDDNSKHAWFNQVASPEVTQKMLQLKNMGDVDSWNTYQKWVSGAFIALFQQDVQQLNNDAQNGHPGMKLPGALDVLTPGGMNNALGGKFQVSWDPNTSQFLFASAGPGGMMPVNGVVGQFNPNSLNQAIQRIVPILRENNIDVSQEILMLLQQMGWGGQGDSPADSMTKSLLDKVTGTQPQ